MGASKCCPNGCREEKLREQMNLRDLEELEAQLEVSVRLSFERLKEVQQSNVVREESDHVQKAIKNDKRSEDNDVELQLYSQTPTKFSATIGQTMVTVSVFCLNLKLQERDCTDFFFVLQSHMTQTYTPALKALTCTITITMAYCHYNIQLKTIFTITRILHLLDLSLQYPFVATHHQIPITLLHCLHLLYNNKWS